MFGNKLLYGLLGVAITIIILANVIPVVWPMATEASGNITAMTGTDPGTTTMKSFWPLVLTIIGLGLAVGVIMYAMKKFNLGKGGGL